MRQRADQEAYFLLGTRESNPLWKIPGRSVEANGSSRLSDPNQPDCSDMPPDDPASHEFMRRPDGRPNHKYYDKIPVSDSIENHEYLSQLPRDKEGQIELSPEIAIDLSLIHSRDYQTQFEQIYLNALSLSGDRFEFDTQWNGGIGGGYATAGEAVGDSKLLSVGDRLGLRRQFSRGGQFATNIANSLSWQFVNGQFSAASGSIVSALTLPLLRGAGTYVRLEGLVQAERDLLYLVRNFARFRRQFYFDVTSNYYSLLGQVQSIRNTKINLESLELNLREHQELLARKMVSQIQVDQVFQDYQNGRLSLLSSEQSLADSLDRFKFQIGLPTWVVVKIDETLLNPFELSSPELEKLQADTNTLYMQLLTFLPPDVPSDEQCSVFFDRYEQLLARVAEQLPGIQSDFDGWQQRLDDFDEDTAEADDRLDWLQQKQIARALGARLVDLAVDVKKDTDELPSTRRDTLSLEREEKPVADVFDERLPPREERWDRLQKLVGRKLREQIGELYVAQIQSRVFAIDLEPVNLRQETAVQFAIENRLDLMNTQAQVVDAFRRSEVAANALKSQLDVTAQVDLRTDPTRNNIVAFESSANSYQVGVDLDGPLNRLNERNTYRASQIAYQQSRRQYMAAEDGILNDVRSDLRQLRIQRLNFQIARQQLIAATRQVDEAQFNLRTAAQSSTNLTRDLLQALQGLLSAKNNLVRSWIGYRTTRISLFVDLELLYLDEQGKWVNEDLSLNELADFLVSIDERQELSEFYGIKRSPLFQSEEDSPNSPIMTEEAAKGAGSSLEDGGKSADEETNPNNPAERPIPGVEQTRGPTRPPLEDN